MGAFTDKLNAASIRAQSHLVVGLDPALDALPDGIDRTPNGVLNFNRAIIEATADLVCAFKPQAAYYEALGPDGWRVLHETVRLIPRDIPVIIDAKRGDIGSTAQAYARAMFDELGADACTVNPYMGLDTIEPYITRPNGFVFVLCRTSNPGAGWLQDVTVESAPLYERVARDIQNWAYADSCGLVVGATDPEAARRVARAAPDLIFLSPGLGPQGGDLKGTVASLGASAAHTIWNASRGVAGASRTTDFADRAREAARAYRDAIEAAVASTLSTTS